MSSIEVIYEHGVLRPLHPLDLAEGTHLAVTVDEIAVSPAGQAASQVDETTYLAFLHELDCIAALPPERAPDPHTVRDHDAVLYPKHGPMP